MFVLSQVVAALPWDCVGLHVCVMFNNDWLAAAAIASAFRLLPTSTVDQL